MAGFQVRLALLQIVVLSRVQPSARAVTLSNAWYSVPYYCRWHGMDCYNYQTTPRVSCSLRLSGQGAAKTSPRSDGRTVHRNLDGVSCGDEVGERWVFEFSFCLRL